MARFVAFLGGINVGGHRVKMDALRAHFEALDLEDVSTFIASGNVLFTAPSAGAPLERKIEAHLHDALGYAVPTFVRSAGAVRAAVERQPFGEIAPPFTQYVAFLATKPTASAKRATEALSNPVDTFEVHGTELHWRVRGGLTDSSVKPKVLATALGQASTVRNVTSLTKLVALL